MIAKIIPGTYDVVGQSIFGPTRRHSNYFRPTLPLGRYLTGPLSIRCESIQQVRAFLQTCRLASDKNQFGRDDYWQTPEQFETNQAGDCDCFALWTWRQLLELGYSARFVVGFIGIRGGCHAWVTFENDDASYILDPVWAWLAGSLPRLRTLWYRPSLSVARASRGPKFFEHQDKSVGVGFKAALPHVPGWVLFWLVHAPVRFGLVARPLPVVQPPTPQADPHA